MFIIDACLRCNFENRPEGPCTYCYNTSPRRKFRGGKYTDVEAIENLLRKEYPKGQGGIILHGGEPLYMKEDVLEKLLKLSFELTGKSNVQTNGSLITDSKIKLFKKYKTHLGISIDGYWPANRWRGKTKKNTDLVIKNILKLKKSGVAVAVLMTLHRDNVVPERIKYMEKLILDLSKEKIPSKINLVYHPDPRIEIPIQQAKLAYLRLAEFVLDNNLPYIRPFESIVNALLGRRSECMFNECDPFCTHATHVTPKGIPNLCGRFENEVFCQGTFPTSVRWNILSQTDCKGCRYGGKVCFGGCPAVAKDWDWRNKDRFCEAYYALFEFFEKKLKVLLPSVPLKTEPGFKPSFPVPCRPASASGRENSLKTSNRI